MKERLLTYNLSLAKSMLISLNDTSNETSQSFERKSRVQALIMQLNFLANNFIDLFDVTEKPNLGLRLQELRLIKYSFENSSSPSHSSVSNLGEYLEELIGLFEVPDSWINTVSSAHQSLYYDLKSWRLQHGIIDNAKIEIMSPSANLIASSRDESVDVIASSEGNHEFCARLHWSEYDHTTLLPIYDKLEEIVYRYLENQVER